MTHPQNQPKSIYWTPRVAVGLLAGWAASGSSAASIEWVLQDVVFDDGGSASGSFFFDADTSTYSAISITTTDGAALTGSFYQFVNFEAGGLDADSVLLVAAANPTAGTPAFNMNLVSAMTNAGGSIDLAMGQPPIAFESTCLISDCSSFFSIDRVAITGSITAVPVPAAIWLFGAALGAIGAFGRAGRIRSLSA